MLKYLTKSDLNYSKALKRAYTISRIENNSNMLNKIAPFLVSDINYLASIITDLNVLSDIMDSGNRLYDIKNLVLSHINTVIDKMNTHNLEMYIKSVNTLTKYINNEKMFVKTLDNLKNKLKIIVNKMTLKYIKDYEINLNSFIP